MVQWVPPALLLELAADDEGLIFELVDAFKVDTAARLQQIRLALTSTDHSRLKREVHTIKGAAKQVGADLVAALCQDIEREIAEDPAKPLDGRIEELESQFEEAWHAMARYEELHSAPSAPSRL